MTAGACRPATEASVAAAVIERGSRQGSGQGSSGKGGAAKGGKGGKGGNGGQDAPQRFVPWRDRRAAAAEETGATQRRRAEMRAAWEAKQTARLLAAAAECAARKEGDALAARSLAHHAPHAVVQDPLAASAARRANTAAAKAAWQANALVAKNAWRASALEAMKAEARAAAAKAAADRARAAELRNWRSNERHEKVLWARRQQEASLAEREAERQRAWAERARERGHGECEILGHAELGGVAVQRARKVRDSCVGSPGATVHPCAFRV